jgi:hypothetical protein
VSTRAAPWVILALLAAVSLVGPAEAGSSGPRWRVSRLPINRAGAYSFAEPGIATGGHGMVILDAASANTGAPPTFWLSRDDGRSWAIGRDFDPTGASTGDVDAALGPDGFMYALNLGYNPNPPGQPANPTVLVFRSRNGRRWHGPASFPLPHGADQPDRPWLVVNPRHPAQVDVANSEGGGNVVIWRSLDHGAHFAGPYPVTEGANSQAALALSSRPLFDPTRSDRMFMLYETATGAMSADGQSRGPAPYEFPLRQLWLATSTDSGQSWRSRLVLDTSAESGALRDATLGHLLVASTIDRSGNLYAALSIRPQAATSTTIYLLHSTTHGATWSAPARVATPTRSNVMPALAVNGHGVVFLSWYGSRAADFRSSDAAWVEMFARVPHPLDRHLGATVSQVPGPGPVHVGGIDTAGNVGSELGANWSLRDFQSIAIGSCGQPRLVWADDYHQRTTLTASPASACRR